MILVLASFRLDTAWVQRARTLILGVVATTRAEAGCIAYDVAEDVLTPGVFRVSERWESREALNAHLAAPHMAEWGKARGAMGMSDRSVAIYTIAGVEDL